MKHFEKMMGEGAFAMSKDNVKADAFHQGYYIDDEFNW